MFGRETILNKTPEAGGCTNTVDLYNPFPDGGGQALYQLNGDATDESGNYDGNFVNPAYGTGEFGQAGVFNGSSSYIDTTYTMPASSTYSISAWFKTSTTGTQEIIIADFDASGSGLTVRFTLGFISSNNFYINMGNGSSSWSNYTTNALPYRDGNWHNIVTVWNGTNVKLYADGNTTPIADLTSTVSAGAAGTSPLNFGRAGDVSGSYFNGSIDQVRIFNRALRPYEVEALYTEEYCTPTIVPSEHFNTVTYTGNGNASNTISQLVTGVGFQPDFVWGKNRDNSNSHILFDSVRLPNNWLSTNNTNTQSNTQYTQSSFTSDGFYTGTSDSLNKPNDGFVSWNFKAGGAAVSNTDGTITSQVSANTEAGFSVVKYTGNNSDATIGHGLSSAPEMMIVKNLDNSDATFNGRWFVYHSALSTRTIYLNLADGATGLNSYPWNSTAPTSAVFSVDSNQSNFDLSILNNNYIAYCFHSVEGFSSIGSYVGNGSTSGPTVVTGFEPAFLLIKQSSASGEYWNIWDNKRSVENPRSDVLFPNLSNAESSNQSWSDVQFLENGFQVTPSVMTPTNANGATYIYMAFAADPTTVEPSLEDSFNTVTYTGNDTNTSYTRDITGFGFQPDFVWIKDRDNGAFEHTLFDSVRGAGSSNVLSSNTTGAEGWTVAAPMSAFIDDGFSVQPRSPWNANNLVNKNGEDFVAWAWKGAELPAINSNGSITSVVSANPAAGFSIVTFTGNGQTGATVGHGLGTAPAVVINKGRANLATYNNWYVWHKDLPNPNTDLLILNNTDASASDGNYFGGSPTDSTLIFGNDIYGPNVNGTTYVNYVFAEVAGFSKFGSYDGNSSTNGPTIDCGFEPAFVMIKGTDGITNWSIYDNKRDTSNPRNHILWTNLSDAELVAYPQTDIDFNATNFQLKGTNGGINSTGKNYIYMAFANQF